MEKKELSKAGSFMANGAKYIIHSSMPIGRYAEFEKLQISAIDDRDPLTMLQDLAEVYTLLNQSKVADATVKLHNTLNGLERIVQSEPHPLLWICTCFIIKEGTDFTTYNEGEARTAIEDWAKEGYDVRDFFALAQGFVTTFMEGLRDNSLPISEQKAATKTEKTTSKAK